jgi:isopropylmalate/homocitrate/citramalate synthase
VGRPPHDIVFGKGAGKGMVKRFVEKLGIEATDEQIGQILVAVKDESLLTKSLVDDYRVEQIARDLLK